MCGIHEKGAGHGQSGWNVGDSLAIKIKGAPHERAGYPAQQALVSALRKIRQNSTTSQHSDISMRFNGVDIIPTVCHEEYSPLLADIEMCMANGHTLSILYQKPYESVAAPRDVDPYGLIHWRERWYMVGHCHLRREVRIFRVDRMKACTTTQQMFVRPDGFSASAFFTARQIYEASSQETVVQLSLDGAEEAIEDLGSHWFLGPRLVEKRPGEALFLVEERILHSYLAHILLAYGRSIAIREPTSLIQRMVTLTVELTQYYSQYR